MNDFNTCFNRINVQGNVNLAMKQVSRTTNSTISTFKWLSHDEKRANGQLEIQFPIYIRLSLITIAPTIKANGHISIVAVGQRTKSNDTVRQLKCQSICNYQSIKNIRFKIEWKKTLYGQFVSVCHGNGNKKRKISHWEIAN